MRKINNILAYCAVFAFLFASCAKDEPSQMGDTPAGDDFAVLKFNSVLNDLAGRAMQKAHFDQVPNCSDEAPDYAVITFMVNDVEMDPVEVEILFENGIWYSLCTTLSTVLRRAASISFKKVILAATVADSTSLG